MSDILQLRDELFKQTQNTGRRGLQRDWSKLLILFEKIKSRLPSDLPMRMLGKSIEELDVEQNDIKALLAYGVNAGWLTAAELRCALKEANDSNPYWFLANMSGKTFGEVIAPKIAQFWIMQSGEYWKKMKTKELYDFEWKAANKRLLRIELKASTEENPRFQQIRPPKMSNLSTYDYDGLLGLSVFRGKEEWWYVPAPDVERLISERIITQQHNGEKVKTDSYWVSLNEKMRKRFSKYYINSSDQLRVRLLEQADEAA